MMNVRFDARYVAVLSRFIDYKHKMLGLVGIRVEPATPLSGVYIVAMSGPQLGCIYDERGEADQAVTLNAPPELVKACRAGNTNYPLVLQVEGNQMTVRSGTTNAHTLYVMPESPFNADQYPDWRAFFRHEPTALPLEDVFMPSSAGLAAFSLDKHVQSIRLHPTYENGPMYVRVPLWDNFVGITMPMRTDKYNSDDCTLTPKPSWLPPAQ